MNDRSGVSLFWPLPIPLFRPFAILQKLSIGVVLTGLFLRQKSPATLFCSLIEPETSCFDMTRYHTCDFSMEALLENGEDFPVCEFDGGKNRADDLLWPGISGKCPHFDAEWSRNHIGSQRLRHEPCKTLPAFHPRDGKYGWVLRWQTIHPIHPSIDKVGDNPVLSIPSLWWNGRYQDRTLRMLGEKEEISLVEFDLDLIRSFRQNEVWGNAYWKVNTYSALLSPKVEPPFVRQPITVPSVHIRAMHPQDLDDIMKIWLNGNLDAHHFIDPSFWKNIWTKCAQQSRILTSLFWPKMNGSLGFRHEPKLCGRIVCR